VASSFPDDEPVGDPVCWLDRVCMECGAFMDDPEAHECERGQEEAEPATPS
jgi:hypothetical protein